MSGRTGPFAIVHQGGKAVRRIRQGWQDERGAILVFALFCFVIMILVAGLAVDFAHFEERRTRMQATLDRAVLAAADIQQELAPRDVVRDYFDRAGLADTPVDVVLDEGLNYRKVNAQTRVTVPTMFVKMVGVPTFSSPAGSAAEELIGNVEISLVLDVSGSMGSIGAGASKSKVDLLKDAANEFIDNMFDTIQAPGVPPGKLSMSIVPYNQQVALGADLGNDFTFTGEHNRSHCADFLGGDFSSTAIGPGHVLQRAAEADLRYNLPSPNFLECQQRPGHDVTALSNSRGQLKARINQLDAGGDTAIDVGMKWGVALLDPAMRPIANHRANSGKVSNELRGRPFDYGRDDVLKVVVVMTDGENTRTYNVKDGYRSGPSSLVRGRDGFLYYYYPQRSGSDDFYRRDSDSWRALAQIGGSYTVLDYREVWSLMTMPYYDSNYVRRATPITNFLDQARSVASFATKDARLNAVCSAAKANGTIIFAIGFEAPANGRAVMRRCATGDAYYYDAAGTSISEAFAGIASAINALRLTQ